MKKLLISFAIVLLGPVVMADDWESSFGLGVVAMERTNIRTSVTEDNRTRLRFDLHRVISDRLRLGTGVDWMPNGDGSRREDPSLAVWRMLDLDYRVVDSAAVNLSVGAARYYREQPSYGYAYELGFKYSLTDHLLLSGGLGYARVDISTNVPADPTLNPKDDLKFYSATLSWLF